jgi:serine/threonine protein phosphatase PrpC
MQQSKLIFQSVGRTHVGKVRSLNEDSLVERSDLNVWAVSDGMGGHTAGDVASGLITTAIGTLAPSARGASLSERLAEVLVRANDELFRRGASMSRNRTMGATVTVLGVENGRYVCLWAGDSRLYRYRDGTLSQVTRDHRYIQDLLDSGVLNEQEAEHHPRRSVITRAVGVDATLKLDRRDGAVEAGDIFLLATDGVTAVCKDAELGEIIASRELAGAADEIVRLCLERGAPDNLSLVLVKATAP